MDSKTFVGLAILLLLACARVGFSQQSKVPPEIWQKAKTKGMVQVMVQLNVPWQAEGNLSKEAVLAQRKAIAAAQDKLLSELAGTQHSVRRRFDSVRGLSLDVGPDALAVLERSPRVVNVTEVDADKPL
jgi:hypothetical protein